MVTDEKARVVQQNFEAFLKLLPELLVDHEGKFALMRDEKVIEFFDTARNAYVHGVSNFPDGLFSVQEVTSGQADLGWFSHAYDHASA